MDPEWNLVTMVRNKYITNMPLATPQHHYLIKLVFAEVFLIFSCLFKFYNFNKKD